jgi:hypothetical protein
MEHMKRHFVPAIVAVFAVAVGLSLGSGRAEAQGLTAAGNSAILNDPFAFYYQIYLPNQQLQSLRPTPLDSINDAMASRQYFTQTNRRALYDPISPYADTYDPLRPFSNQQPERVARVRPFAQDPSNASGRGPSLYFTRMQQYYPNLSGRRAQNRNANVSARRGSSRGAGGMGMGGTGGMGGMSGMGGGGMGMF